MNNGTIKRIDIKEFREFGYLQEVNRQFFHPRGLALEVNVDNDGNESLGGIWDYRDDPQGIIYGFDESNNERLNIALEKKKRVEEASPGLTGTDCAAQFKTIKDKGRK